MILLSLSSEKTWIFRSTQNEKSTLLQSLSITLSEMQPELILELFIADKVR